MASYLPYIVYSVMSGTGLEVILGAVYVISTVKTAASSAEYVHSWVKWAREKKNKEAQEKKSQEAWQWIEDDEDEFVIEKDIG